MTGPVSSISKAVNPFCEMIGLEFTEFNLGYSKCRLNISDKLLNPHNVLHGGAIYTMADTGMGGALYGLMKENETCATVEIKINYIRSIRTGHLVCTTRVIHKAKSVAFLESTVKDHEDQLIATATGTYYVFTPKKNINDKG